MSSAMLNYRDAYEHRIARLPGSGAPWLTRMRSSAMTDIRAAGFPDTRVEDWKYTDLRSLARRSFTPATESACSSDLTPWLFDNATDAPAGVRRWPLRPGTDPFETLLTGVTLTSLAHALVEPPGGLEHVLGRTLDPERPGFNAINTAFMQDGAFIRLERNACWSNRYTCCSSATGQADAMTTLRNVIAGRSRQQGTVIESYVALNDAAF